MNLSQLIYCLACLENYLKNNNNLCPVSNHKNCKYAANRMYRRRIDSLQIKCPNNSDRMSKDNMCSWFGRVSQMCMLCIYYL